LCVFKKRQIEIYVCANSIYAVVFVAAAAAQRDGVPLAAGDDGNQEIDDADSKGNHSGDEAPVRELEKHATNDAFLHERGPAVEVVAADNHQDDPRENVQQRATPETCQVQEILHELLRVQDLDEQLPRQSEELTKTRTTPPAQS
jgi:hypothetical protein